MKKFLSVIALMLINVNAYGGSVPLPTTLDKLLPTGNYATVSDLKFYDFEYSTSPVGIQPQAKNVTVSDFNNQGIEFSGAFFATNASVNDYVIQYTIFSPTPITSLTLSGVFGGPGTGSVTELLTNPLTGKVIGSLEIDNGKIEDSINFKGVYDIIIQKDITVYNNSTISIIDQGFNAIPEPSSMVLWGTGLIIVMTYMKMRK
jgi:hypothetical protein